MEHQENKQDHKKDHEHHHGHGHPHDNTEKKGDEKEHLKTSDQTAEKAPQEPEGATAQLTPPKEEQKDERRKDREKIDELKSQLDAANDKYLRLMAEFDNFKRRTAKEYQQLIEQANEKLIKDLIEVRENFERAFKAHNEGADTAPFMDGMKMVFSKLDSVLRTHGLEVYCEPGQEFDPQLHDAMMKTPHEKIPEHHIAEVCEKGYRLRGKVIKHSRVIVSSGKGAAEAPPKEEEAVIEVAVDPDQRKKNDDTGDSA